MTSLTSVVASLRYAIHATGLSVVVLLCCFMMIGCTDRLELNSVPDLPSHWQHVPEQGTDSQVGRFISTENHLVIHYDIGNLAGEYASRKACPNCKWVRSGRLDGNSFRYLLNDDDTLYVTFLDEGPANFWCKVGGQDDVDYVLELLARHRHELLARKNSGNNALGAKY